MGIQGQVSLLFKSKEIGFDDIIYVMEHLHSERRWLQITSRAWPKVTVNASLLGYKFLGGASFHPANGIYLICTALANHNIDVLVICDPPTCHHSKRAHHQRVGKKEKIRLQLMLRRMKLACLRGMIEQVTHEIRKLKKADCRMLENICKGCDGNEHCFLAAEGVSSCNTCKASICRICTWNDSNENNTPPVCFECKRYNIACEDEQLTEQEMRQYLKEHAVNVPAVATYADVLKLFQQYNNDSHDIFAEDIQHIRYPILPAASLNSCDESSNKILRLSDRVEVHQIGFIFQTNEYTGRPNVVARSVLGIIHFFASLSIIQQRKVGEKLSFRHGVPLNLLNMAENARIHTSKHLTKWALCHATDCATPDIMNGKLQVGFFEDDVCVIIDQTDQHSGGAASASSSSEGEL